MSVYSFFLGLALLLPQGPTFKIDAAYIKVPVSVLDADGRPLLDLSRQDFSLRDEGEPAPIENFLLDRRSTNVLMLLDVSSSIPEELDELGRAVVQFARHLDRNDRIAVVSFSDDSTLIQPWTNDLKRLRKSLDQLERGYRTALYDALLSTPRRYLAGAEGKKVIILFTDGLDNQSRASYEEVAQHFARSDIGLYIVSRSRWVRPQIAKSDRVDFLNQVMKNVLKDDTDYLDIYFREKEVAMEDLCRGSGGRVFYPARLSELEPTYRQLARELKSQYVLTFRPPETSSQAFRTIEVICSRPVSQVLYRQTYNWQPRNTN